MISIRQGLPVFRDPVRAAITGKLLKRLNRIRGQVEAIRRALEAQALSTAVLQQATACRGVRDDFIAEVIEDHIRERVVDAGDRASATEPAEELVGIVHSYLT